MTTTGFEKPNDIGAELCPEPMTRVTLLALRNNGGLSKDCHYVVTDYNRGTVGAATILLHAVDESTLSINAQIKTSFDNDAWSGLYDANTNRIISLSDGLGNVVSGQNSVDIFPWGVSSIQRNTVENSSLVYSGGNVRDNAILGGSNLTISGGTFDRNSMSNTSKVTINSGTNNNNTFQADCDYRQIGTGTLNECVVGGEATIQNGDVVISDSQFFRSSINLTDTSGDINTGLFHGVNGTQMNLCTNLSIGSSSFSDATELRLRNSSDVRLDTCNLGRGRITVSNGSVFRANQMNILSLATINVTSGRLDVDYLEMESISQITQQSAGSNTVSRSSLSSGGVIRFRDVSDGNLVRNCNVGNASYIDFVTDTMNNTVTSSTADTGGRINIQNNTDGVVNGCSATSYGRITLINTRTGQSHQIYRCSATASGQIEMRNALGFVRMYSCNASGQGIIRLQNSADASRLYYCSISSYFYLTVTLNGLFRNGLNAHGRRTLTITDPPNGAFVQNF